jgi:hypothetical protein
VGRGIDPDWEERTVTGKLGWQPREEEAIVEWSEAEQDWLSATEAPRQRKLMPWGWDREKRLLGVLTDGASAPATIAAVFEKIQRANEEELHEPTTEWSVEPVLDRANFVAWRTSWMWCVPSHSRRGCPTRADGCLR